MVAQENEDLTLQREALKKFLEYVLPDKPVKRATEWDAHADCQALKKLHELSIFILEDTNGHDAAKRELEELDNLTSGYTQPDKIYDHGPLLPYIEAMHSIMINHDEDPLNGMLPLPGTGGDAKLRIERGGSKTVPTKVVVLSCDKLGARDSNLAHKKFGALTSPIE